MLLFGDELLARALIGRAMQPQPRRRGAPGLHTALRVGQIAELFAGEEVAAHVLHNPLHSRFVLR